MYFVLQRYALKSDCMLQKHYYLHREWIKMCGNTSCDALLCVVAQVTFCSCPTTDGELPNYRRQVARLQTTSCPTACRYLPAADGRLPDCLPVLGRLHTDTCPGTGVYPGKYGRWDRGQRKKRPSEQLNLYPERQRQIVAGTQIAVGRGADEVEIARAELVE